MRSHRQKEAALRKWREKQRRLADINLAETQREQTQRLLKEYHI
jgi:hypothetical protein